MNPLARVLYGPKAMPMMPMAGRQEDDRKDASERAYGLNRHEISHMIICEPIHIQYVHVGINYYKLHRCIYDVYTYKLDYIADL